MGSLPFCKCLLTRPIIQNLGLSLCSINWQISWRKYVFHLSFYCLSFCGLKQQSLFCYWSQFLWVKNLERFSSGYSMMLQSVMWSWDSGCWSSWGQALHGMLGPLFSGSFEYLHLDSTCGLVWASFSMVSSVQLDCLCSGSRTWLLKFCASPVLQHCQNYISSVQSLSRVRLFAIPWIAACQASLSIINSRSLPKLMSIQLVMPFRHLILCHPLLLLPPIPPSIRVFSNESTLHMRWPKYWSFSLSISPANEHTRLVSFRMDWLDLLAVQGTCKSLSMNMYIYFSMYISYIINRGRNRSPIWWNLIYLFLETLARVSLKQKMTFTVLFVCLFFKGENFSQHSLWTQGLFHRRLNIE